MRVRIISEQLEVLIAEVENVTHLRIEFHLRERTKFARQLQSHLIEMIVVDMRIAERMDKLSCFEPGNVRNHLQQQRVRSDVERHSEENIRAALVELQAESPVGNVELKEGMAGRQVHISQITDIPCADDDAARVRIVANHVDRLTDLIDRSAFVISPRTSLVTVDRPQITVRIRPFVPDAYAMLLQVTHIRIALQEPQQLVNDRFQMQSLGRKQRESLAQVESHLIPEYARCPRPCTVFLCRTGAEHMP